ncbi:MAG: hypothetical protein ACJ764_10115 [Solirubrobacteraceae bacterium]
MNRMGLRTLAFVGALACILAALPGPAFAGAGARHARVFAKAEVAYYASRLPAGLRSLAALPGSAVDKECFAATDNHLDPGAPPGGTPSNPAWYRRDALNQYCATLRLRDQFANRAYGYENLAQGDGLWLDQLGQQISVGPGHIHGGLTTLIPGSQAADSFRTVDAWRQRTGGTVLPVSFASSDGATLRGNIWMPPPGTPALKNGRHPGVVVTDGSIQAYQQLYHWIAEGLAQYGYEVITFDPQGQGDSDLLPSTGHCGPTQFQSGNVACQGVPYQQNYNFYQGTEDALNFLLSTPSHPYRGTFNPGYRSLARNDVAIAGHSLGASAVSWVGQCDRRVRAVIAWDDLEPITMSKCQANVTVPRADRARTLHAPALAMTNDYEFNIQSQLTVPDPNGSANGGGLSGTSGYLSLVKHRIDSEIISIRNGTHLTYSYIPYVLPSNEIGERVAFYYTLAWLDEYLRGGRDGLLPAPDTAYHRLTSLGKFDQSPDHSDNRAYPGAADISFGAGTYNETQAAAHPTDQSAGNVPYKIRGIPIRNTLSFYYYSEFSLHDRGAKGSPLRTCVDMLAGCPAKQPRTP